MTHLPGALAATGALVLALSLGIALASLGSEALITARAHETEARSLQAVALFPGHGLRELPHVLVLALAFAGAVAPARSPRAAGRQIARAATGTALCGAVLFVWAGLEAGWASAWSDLRQHRGAVDLEAPGIHVRMHLVSDVALGALFLGAAGLFERAGLGVGLLAAAGLLGALAGAAGTAGVSHPRFVGHAVREIVTHVSVTLPLLLAWTASRAKLRATGRRLPWWSWVAVAVAAATTGALLLLLPGPAVIARYSSAPQRPLALNLAVHNFEHLIDLGVLIVLTKLMVPSQGAHRD